VLTYALPKKDLLPFLPECLTLDTLNDQYAFLAVAVVKTRGLRPKGFPEFLGSDFLLTGYRIFVTYVTSEGKRLRGLYILGSETDKRKMAFLGNIFSHYRYERTDIQFRQTFQSLSVRASKSDLDIEILVGGSDIQLPTGSVFTNWKEARRFAGPLPFTFSYNKHTGEVLIIEGVRENWTPQPVQVIHHRVGFIDRLGLTGAALANAFVINNIPYYWKKGRKDLWKPS
jgi:hypothetical protein